MITAEQYQNFLIKILDFLEGDWVVIGGSLLALIKADSRVTADIDLCSIDELTNEKRLSLMKLATEVGLNIEAINPAADFFLNQIPNWKSSIILYKSGIKGSEDKILISN